MECQINYRYIESMDHCKWMHGEHFLSNGHNSNRETRFTIKERIRKKSIRQYCSDNRNNKVNDETVW